MRESTSRDFDITIGDRSYARESVRAFEAGGPVQEARQFLVDSNEMMERLNIHRENARQTHSEQIGKLDAMGVE